MSHETMDEETSLERLIRRTNTLASSVKYLRNWPTFCADFAGLIPTEKVTYRFRNGLIYEIRSGSNDRGILTEVWLKDYYSRMTEGLTEKCKVIDLGAHIGMFSTFVAANTGCMVYAYEPFSENYEMLVEHISRNNLENCVVPFNMAVSDKGGEINLYISEHNTGGHSLLIKQKKYILVECITIEEVFRRNEIDVCHLLKIDVEGSEYRILYGANKETLEKIRKIVLEVHEFPAVLRHNHDDLQQFLTRAGYSVEWCRPYLYCSR